MNTDVLIIIGTSNSGKSPLGDIIEKEAGTHGHSYYHLDFGEILRGINRGELDYDFEGKDLQYISSIMDGQLLDDDHFYIAETIISGFLKARDFGKSTDVLILNGLPRHLGQARGLQGMNISVSSVIYLKCSPEVAFERKMMAERKEGHEDRSHRKDSAYRIFKRKLISFQEDTLPILDYYSKGGVDIITVEVTPDLSPSQMYNRISKIYAEGNTLIDRGGNY